MEDNMSWFETKVENLSYRGKRTRICPKGTIANAFSNNPVFKHHTSKWQNKASNRIMKLLEQLRLRLEL